jgi:hypothetical protein
MKLTTGELAEAAWLATEHDPELSTPATWNPFWYASMAEVSSCWYPRRTGNPER